MGKNRSGEVLNPAYLGCIRLNCRHCLFLLCEFLWKDARVLWKMSLLAWEPVPGALTLPDMKILACTCRRKVKNVVDVRGR